MKPERFSTSPPASVEIMINGRYEIML